METCKWITPAGVNYNSLHNKTVNFAERHKTWNSFDAILIVCVAKGVAQ